MIPVYNGEKYIDQCFGHLLNQRYSNIEIIVVNDGSTDNTEELLKQYEQLFADRGYIYRHIYQKNARLAVAMNNALQYVSGKYVMIYEIDDVLYRDGILDKVLYLEDNPEVSMVRNNRYYIKSFNEIERNPFIYRDIDRNENTVFEDILFGKTNNWPASYLIRVSDFFRALGENHKVYEHPGGTHLQFMLPMAYGKKVGFIDKPLMDYYAHVDSDSHSGGYEANLRRSNWYEEIRQEVIKRIDMPEEKRDAYSRKLNRMYNRNKMLLAMSHGDREKYQQYALELNVPTWKSSLSWATRSSIVGKAVKTLSKATSVAERKIRILNYNRKLWSNNAKGY